MICFYRLHCVNIDKIMLYCLDLVPNFSSNRVGWFVVWIVFCRICMSSLAQTTAWKIKNPLKRERERDPPASICSRPSMAAAAPPPPPPPPPPGDVFFFDFVEEEEEEEEYPEDSLVGYIEAENRRRRKRLVTERRRERRVEYREAVRRATGTVEEQVVELL